MKSNLKFLNSNSSIEIPGFFETPEDTAPETTEGDKGGKGQVETFGRYLTGGECQVTCKFGVDDITKNVYYNADRNSEEELEILGGDLTEWRIEKHVTFEACDREEPGKIIVMGRNAQKKDHCKLGGLIMHCVAHQASPWNDFKTDAENWVDLSGNYLELCINNEGIAGRDDTPYWLTLMIESGAVKIWTNTRDATLLGKPKPVWPAPGDLE